MSFCHEEMAEADDRYAAGADRALAAQAETAPGWKGQATDTKPGLVSRAFSGFANRRGMAFLPDEFPSPAICWRRLRQWEGEGVLAGGLAGVARSAGCRGGF
jgi:hypothetical protein